MRLKKTIGFIHLWLGLLSGLVVFIVSITGCIYAFEEEIRNTVHKDLYAVEHSNNKAKPISEIISTVKKEFPKQKVKSIKIKSNTESSVQINLKNKTAVFVNPYTAKVIGSINQESDFFSIVLKIHRELYLGKAGKNITGISCLIFLIMLISGIILWWPKTKFRKQNFTLMLKAKSKRKNYDLHSVLGFYAAWILIFTVLTGLIWSFKWAENTMYWLSNSKKEKQQEITSTFNEKAKTVSVEKILIQTKAFSQQGTEQILFMPDDSVGVIRLTQRFENIGFYTQFNQFTFDQYNAKLLKVKLFKYASTGDKLKTTNYNIHTGKVFNLPGQFLVFFASLISASLPITGFLMWWGKRKKKKLIEGKA